jgi:hypothetical protein
MSNKFKASYYYKKPGAAGKGARTQLNGTVPANTESAVMELLRKKHKGYEITLMNLEWK